MNYLFHMLLSGDDELLVGNFMGDFVKGRLDDRFPPRIRQGVALHRAIDSFADKDPSFRKSRFALDARYGLYRGVLVDLFYDHFLVRDWHTVSPSPLAAFLKHARSVVERHHDELPERQQKLVTYIFEELIPLYGEIDGVADALRRMSRRIGRPNPLSGGEAELVAHYESLHADFQEFTPRARLFAADACAVQERDRL